MASLNNPLLEPWTLPHNFPPFNLIQAEHFGPAFDVAMKAHMDEVLSVANNPEPPTFENTLVAMEKAGQLFGRIESVFGGLTNAFADDALKAVESDMAPKLAKHADDIALNPALFQRVRMLYDQRESLKLDPESDRLLWQYHEDFVRAGARLSAEDQDRLRTLNTELATLQTTFSQHLAKEVADSSVWFEDASELDGLPASAISAAAEAAASVDAAQRKGKFQIKLINTTGQPCLDSLTNPASRAKIMAASLARGTRGGPHDAREFIVQITAKRLERAKLLGHPNHSSFQLADQTIGGTEQANKLLRDLAPAAVRNARAEHKLLQDLADQQGAGVKVTAADWDFYSEQVRRRDYAFDESNLKPYFELNRVFKDGVLYAASKLYGLKFEERTDLPVFEPTVKVYNVFEEDGKTLVALFVVDLYAREKLKRGGAWMMQFQAQSDLLGNIPVVGNFSNIPRPAAGEPALINYDDVRTLFHEFGHALHGMLSKVKYPRFSGTNVPTDFVEFPSQVNEMWGTFPDVISNYAKHYQTGEPIDPALLAKFKAAERFNQGYATTEFLAAALLDQAYHQISAPLASADEVVPFETKALEAVGLDFAPVPPRYRSAYFAHIFSTSSYSSKYCAYLWSEVLDSHAADWIRKNGGLKREVGDKLRACVLSRGGSAEPLGLFQSFVDSTPDITPLLVKKGLTL